MRIISPLNKPVTDTLIRNENLGCYAYHIPISAEYNQEEKPMTDKALIEFPCEFPIKIMGRMHDDFVQTMANLLMRLDTAFKPEKIVMRPSAKNNYLAITAYVYALDQTHLNNIYQALTQHPMVMMVL